MLNKVRAWIDRHSLLAAGDRIVAACSGGPDSLALVHMLYELRREYKIELAVAHVNHMFRPEAVEEARFVKEYCDKLGIACYQQEIDVPAFIHTSGKSAQEAARMLRYRYLREVAADFGAAKIATGHHRDDQIETVLINFIRGAGTGGLKGMKPRNGDIIRPLLALSRAEIEAYITANSLTPCLDSSNLKTNYLRNRIRLKLLPLLASEYNPSIHDSIWRTAEVTGDEYDYICQAARKAWRSVITEDAARLLVESSKFARLHTAVKRELIRQAIEKKRGTLTGISFVHVENLLKMTLHGRVGTFFVLPGGAIARKNYIGLELFGGKSGLFRQAEAGKYRETFLKLPGVTQVPDLGIKVKATIVDRPDFSDAGSNRGNSAVFDLGLLLPPLVVRTRLPGDRFRPLGMKGSKKLKEYFIDVKVPQTERDTVPLVCDSQGILWIAGYRQSETAKVTGQTTKFLKLVMTKQEDF
ncbi:MAG TPA: tRNA lysidine(34) synthetase TilS [Methylomusa anaerophila]|uniref:tRNA(Ile)-lysidine synthase n=1 Tax=Methylomusa anaerophila TaxID=1930071 RepID=A0A348AJK8_9FIRM|nr:tRNA lysidine(34) synthetase TilS [Methylomusa anaerophila]BBB91256.1 tRNA(Ile)-lysidine synthase [Methylomusa anaerophila]HML89750.1 tRNA lysidine(34) synthetase TilS [Methylomusa anaerophila]